MSTFMLALRNLRRNRRRSIATLSAIALGSISVLLFGGYSKNIKYSMQTAYVASGGHLQIQHKSFFLYGSGNPTAYGIVEYARIIDGIRNDPALRDMVDVATPTLQFGGIAGNYEAGVSRTIIGNGLVAAEYSKMRRWNDFDLPPMYPPFALDGSPPDAAVVGVGVARVLQMCEALAIADCPKPESKQAVDGKALPADIAQLGALEASSNAGRASAGQKRIELLASNSRGTPNVASVQIVKADNQGFKELDEVYVQLHLAQAQRLIYGRDRPRVTAIMVQLHHSDQMAVAEARIASLLATLSPNEPLAVLSFETLNPFYVQTIQLFDTIFGFMFVLIGGIVLFTVSNTMNTAVIERTVEIGTLRAIGLRRGGIRKLFVAEGVILGVLGAAIGCVFSLTSAFIVNRLGLTWLPPGTAEHLPLKLKVWGEAPMVIGTTVGLIVITTVSAWWPSYRASNLSVVDALRHT